MASITVRDDAERAALDAILGLINGGSGDDAGDFELLTNVNGSLCSLPFRLGQNAFDPAQTVGGVAQAVASSIRNSQTPMPGNIANGRFRDKANSAVVTFDISVTAGGGAMEIGDVVIPSNATAVSCSSITVKLNVTV